MQKIGTILQSIGTVMCVYALYWVFIELVGSIPTFLFFIHLYILCLLSINILESKKMDRICGNTNPEFQVDPQLGIQQLSTFSSSTPVDWQDEG